MCPTEDRAERYVMTADDDPEFEEHLLICPVCQDTVERLTREIDDIKAAARALELTDTVDD